MLLVVAACLVGFMLGSAFTLAVLQDAYRFRNKAVVKAVGVEVYADAALSVPLSEVDWGLVAPGEAKTFVCYVKSASTMGTVLSLTAGNWAPLLAEGYLTVSWSRDCYVLPAGALQ